MFNLIKVVGFRISRTVENNNEFVRKSQKLRLKLKNIKQSVGETQQIASFIKQNSKQQIAAKIQRTANNQRQFKDFLNKFNEKHKDTINVLDLSNYAKKFEDLSQPGLNKQDLKMLQEFRKRRLQRQFKKISQPTTKKQIRESIFDLKKRIKSRKIDPNADYLFKSIKNAKKSDNQLGQQDDINLDNITDSQMKDPQLKQDTKQRYYQGPFQIRDKFYCLMLDRDSTTCVTTLNRINTSRCIIFMANGNGIIGYARGHGKDYGKALQNAIANCKKNLIAIPIDPDLGLPKKIHKTFQDYDMKLTPLNFVDPYGHPVMATLLLLSGLSHFKFKTVHTGKSLYGVVNVLFKCLVNNTTPKEISQQDGYKIYRHQWVKPYKNFDMNGHEHFIP